MHTHWRWLFLAWLTLSGIGRCPGAEPERETRQISGWTVYISKPLLTAHPDATEHALVGLKKMLDEIIHAVPAPAVAELQKVPLWISPTYDGVRPRAEYHPGRGWLVENHRDPAMARGVEFTNILIFDEEMRRMPNFALHELAHAYHHRVLGYNNPKVIAAYEAAKQSGKYDAVTRRDAAGKESIERAYAMTNPMEYFAELSEALFSTNDFFPFTRTELEQHDSEAAKLLLHLWTTPPTQ